MIVMQLYHANDLFIKLNNGVFGTKVVLLCYQNNKPNGYIIHYLVTKN
jgi:hypothetical protein